jgi:hypothetical protein
MDTIQKRIEAASQLYEGSIGWLQQRYSSYRFFTERDIVWTVQTYLSKEIESRNLSLKVFDNHKVTGNILVDLVIIDKQTDSILVGAEFKYEHDHKRIDITPGKLNPSKAFWDSKKNHGVVQDVDRIKKLVEQGDIQVGYITFVDEGGHHTCHGEPEDCIWVEWGVSPYSSDPLYALLYRCQK